MPGPEEIIFERPDGSNPDDKIWMEQGKKLLDGSFDAAIMLQNLSLRV